MPGKKEAKVDNLLKNLKILLEDIKKSSNHSKNLESLVNHKVLTSQQGLFRAVINLVAGTKSRYDRSNHLPGFHEITKEVWLVVADIYKNILNYLKDIKFIEKIKQDINTIIHSKSLSNQDCKYIVEIFKNVLNHSKKQRSASVPIRQKAVTTKPNTVTPSSNRVVASKSIPKSLLANVNKKNRSQTATPRLNVIRSKSCAIPAQAFSTPNNIRVKSSSSLMPPPATALAKRKRDINSTEYEYDKSKQFLHNDKIRQQKLKLIEAKNAAAEAKRIEAKNARLLELCNAREERVKKAAINREKNRIEESENTSKAVSKIAQVKLPERRKINKTQQIPKYIKDYISFIEDKIVKLNIAQDFATLNNVKSEVKRYISSFGMKYPNSINLPAKKDIDKKYQEFMKNVENMLQHQTSVMSPAKSTRSERYERKLAAEVRSPQKTDNDLSSVSIDLYPEFEKDAEQFVSAAKSTPRSERYKNKISIEVRSDKKEQKWDISENIEDSLGDNRSVELETEWFTDNEINKLLKHFFENKKNVRVLDAIDVEQRGGDVLTENLYEDQLQQALTYAQLQQNIIIMPINLGHRHWVALCIRFNTENRLKPVINYVDPFGDRMPDELKNSLLKVYNCIQLEDIIEYQIRIQEDGYNCGPWVIFTLNSLVHNDAIPDKDVDIVDARKMYRDVLSGLNIVGGLQFEEDPKQPDSASLYLPLYKKSLNCGAMQRQNDSCDETELTDEESLEKYEVALENLRKAQLECDLFDQELTDEESLEKYEVVWENLRKAQLEFDSFDETKSLEKSYKVVTYTP